MLFEERRRLRSGEASSKWNWRNAFEGRIHRDAVSGGQLNGDTFTGENFTATDGDLVIGSVAFRHRRVTG